MDFYNENSHILRERTAMLSKFIHTYDCLINLYVLDFFFEKHWESIPSSWQNVLSKLEPEDLSVFLDSSEILSAYEVWPLSLLSFRAAAFALALPRRAISSPHTVKEFLEGVFGKRCSDYELSSWKSCDSLLIQNKSIPEVCRKHVKPKKQHEIHRLAKVTSLVLQDIGIDHVIDVGSGLGHLSRLLCLEYNLKVATVEALSTHANTASAFDMQALQSLTKKDAYSSSSQFISKTQGIKSLEALPQHFKAFIAPNYSNEFFEETLKEVWSAEQVTAKEKMLPFAMVGLHTCGDLSATLLKLFVDTPSACAVLSVGCCYMKLNAETEQVGYPMSDYVKKLPYGSLTYAARELSCHALENYIQRLKGNAASLKIHCYRALLEKIIVEYYPENRHMGLRGVKHSERLPFHIYAEKALSKSSLQIPQAAFLSKENEKCLQEWKKVVAVYSLRLLTAPVIESLILLDRMLYLLENGCYCCVLPVFEPSISPRNHLIFAVKKN